MSERALKRCPFCGWRRKESYADAPRGERRYWALVCESCGAHGPSFSEYTEAEAIAAWNTRAEASSAEPVAWMYRSRFGTELCKVRWALDEGITSDHWKGWTETPLYAHPPAAPDTVTLDRALGEEVLRTLRLLHSYGCPACSGDCASANPPMIICPTADGQAAIFKLTEALK